MRIVIVGAGVIGLLAAVHAVGAGHFVALYDQAEIPYSDGASFDPHRVLRVLHPADPAATVAASRAHGAWMELQQLLSIRCYEPVGVLTIMALQRLPQARALLADADWPALSLSPASLATCYPHLRFTAGAAAVLETGSGVVLADQLLTACAGWLRADRRVELHPHRAALRVETEHTTVVFTDGERVRADAILLATGAWSRALVPTHIGDQLELYRQSVLYAHLPRDVAAGWSGTPAILSLGLTGDSWLVPPVAGTPLKLSDARAARLVAELTGAGTPPDQRSFLIDQFSTVIDGFSTDWVAGSRDSYYLARRGGGPLVVQTGRAVVSYPACGGASFKFAPLIAADLIRRLTGSTDSTARRYRPPAVTLSDSPAGLRVPDL